MASSRVARSLVRRGVNDDGKLMDLLTPANCLQITSQTFPKKQKYIKYYLRSFYSHCNAYTRRLCLKNEGRQIFVTAARLLLELLCV
jgi:hypothetical protein